jgi:hypothetical protein
VNGTNAVATGRKKQKQKDTRKEITEASKGTTEIHARKGKPATTGSDATP